MITGHGFPCGVIHGGWTWRRNGLHGPRLYSPDSYSHIVKVTAQFVSGGNWHPLGVLESPVALTICVAETYKTPWPRHL